MKTLIVMCATLVVLGACERVAAPEAVPDSAPPVTPNEAQTQPGQLSSESTPAANASSTDPAQSPERSPVRGGGGSIMDGAPTMTAPNTQKGESR
jgi:hypothetical protein